MAEELTKKMKHNQEKTYENAIHYPWIYVWWPIAANQKNFFSFTYK